MATDWSRIYQKYKGFWVALKDDEQTVVANGRTVKEVIDRAKKKGYPHPILTKMPNELITYVGYGL